MTRVVMFAAVNHSRFTGRLWSRGLARRLRGSRLSSTSASKTQSSEVEAAVAAEVAGIAACKTLPTVSPTLQRIRENINYIKKILSPNLQEKFFPSKNFSNIILYYIIIVFYIPKQ